MSTAIAAPRPGLDSWLRLMFLGMVWGGSFIGIALALRGFGPLTVAAGRLVIGAAALLAFAAASGARLPPLSDRRLWAWALAVSMLSNAVPFALLSWAQLHVPAGLAAVFMALLPLMVLPLSHAFIPGERMTLRRTAGFAVGSVGAIILLGPEALAGLTGAGMTLLGEIACFLVVLLYACGSIAAKRAPAADPVGFSAMVLLISAAALTPLALAFERPWAADPPPEAVLGLLWLGLLSTGLAQVLLLQVLWRAGPPFLSQVNFMVPVWALGFGVALLNEPVQPRAVLALALIFIGVAVAQGLLGRLTADRARG